MDSHALNVSQHVFTTSTVQAGISGYKARLSELMADDNIEENKDHLIKIVKELLKEEETRLDQLKESAKIQGEDFLKDIENFVIAHGDEILKAIIGFVFGLFKSNNDLNASKGSSISLTPKVETSTESSEVGI